MLAIAGVSRRYGPLLALDDVSFTVAPGTIVGLLGANGAGKSTLMRTAAGLQPPDAGSVRVGNIDVWAGNPVEAKKHLGYAAEEPTLVTFTLEDAPARGTRLTVVESGFDKVPPRRRLEAFRLNSGGWDVQVGNIARHVGG